MYTVEPVADFIVITMRGEFDLANSQGLSDTLEGLRGRNVRIDLTRVNYLDSTALGIILRFHRSSVASGGKLWVRLTEDPQMVRLFQLTGLDKLLNIELVNQPLDGVADVKHKFRIRSVQSESSAIPGTSPFPRPREK